MKKQKKYSFCLVYFFTWFSWSKIVNSFFVFVSIFLRSCTTKFSKINRKSLSWEKNKYNQQCFQQQYFFFNVHPYKIVKKLKRVWSSENGFLYTHEKFLLSMSNVTIKSKEITEFKALRIYIFICRRCCIGIKKIRKHFEINDKKKKQNILKLTKLY